MNAEIIQTAIQGHENIYNDLMSKFYSPIQYALEGQNAQTLQSLREQWTSGTIPEQDEFAIAIQSLRNTVEQYQEDPSVQNEVADLDKRVSQLESMHNEITNDLQNTLSGGRRKRISKTRKTSKKSKKSRAYKRSKGTRRT